MISKANSLEEKTKLPPTETISRCYQPQQNNRKIIRILTVVVYVLCVSLAAIMLSLYYIFIWDPTIRPFVTKSNHCDKLVIPEKIAIRFLNSTEVTAEQFYRHILDQYRIQLQRQKFSQKQHLELQRLDATNRFQEIFATATIIQSHRQDAPKNSSNPTKNTYQIQPIAPGLEPPQEILLNNGTIQSAQVSPPFETQLSTTTNLAHFKRKSHRSHYKHYRAHANSTGKSVRKYQKKLSNRLMDSTIETINPFVEQPTSTTVIEEQYSLIGPSPVPTTSAVIQQSPQLLSSMAIPLLLSSIEEKPIHQIKSDQRLNPQAQRHPTSGLTSDFVKQSYLNSFLPRHLIVEE